MYSLAMPPQTKRKHVTASLAKKCEVLKELESGKSVRFVAMKFNMAKSTVADIKRKGTQIKTFVSSSYHTIRK